MTLYPKLIMDALATVTYAGTKKNLVESGMVADTPAIAAASAEGEPWRVKVVLEFINNSNKDFISVNGIIYRGTKFYMVASVVPPGDMGFEKRVLTRGYMTTVNLTIGSLKTAYNALPDLRSDKLRLFDVVEAGIRKWQVGQTGEHEVFNW
jgi:hypothetical protein